MLAFIDTDCGSTKIASIELVEAKIDGCAACADFERLERRGQHHDPERLPDRCEAPLAGSLHWPPHYSMGAHELDVPCD